jgi:xanthine dehydrogenase accessory factor
MTMDVRVYEELLRLKRQGSPSALAILIDGTGSSPQKAGAKMLVRSDGSTVGTVGGGRLEADVIQTALHAITSGSPQTISLELTEEHGHACGGNVLVYVEPVFPDPRLLVFGAGHVGRALCTAARFCGFHVTVIDDRPEFANRKHFPDANATVVSDFEEAFSLDLFNGDIYVVIATRGHRHDFQVLEKALTTQAHYIGLVGSKKKKEALIESLTRKGFGEEDIRRVVIPVGLPIGSVTPEEIAVSIVAQLVQHRRLHGLAGVSHTACSGSIPADGNAQATP